MSDLIGKTFGSYRILEQIGVGGMATVYKAYQPSMDRYVAVKVLPHYLSKDEQFAKRFQREARAIAKLEHAHILPVHDYGEADGITYIVMRYIDAGTLKQRIAQGPLPLDEINRVVGQMGSALDYAHRMGVIHRDVKPGNVLIDAQGNAYLTDFGLARMMEASDQLTASGVGVGTPAYMSPEQGQGVKVDHRSDIYSLGVVLFEMVTGHVPYEAETPMAVMLKHITDPLPLPRTVNPDVPEPIELVVLKALAKDPAHRYQTAGEMVQALNVAVRKVGPVELPRPAAAEGRPAEEDISLITRLERAWARPRGKVGVIGGAIAAVALLALVLSQLPGQVQIVGSGPTTVPTQAAALTSAPRPTPTATLDRTADIRAFADPILAAIANRPPDYQDDFSDPGSGWDIASYAEGRRSGKVGYNDNEYFLIADRASAQYPDVHSWLEIPALEVSDFVMEFDTRVISAGHGAIYVHFRVQEKNVYAADVAPEGWLRLATQTIEGDTPLAEARGGPFKLDEVNRVRIIAAGSRIALYLNDRAVLMADKEFTDRGGIILGIWNGSSAPMQVNFDNFRVWDIAQAPADTATAGDCRIASVQDDGDIYVRNCDGSGVRQVTFLKSIVNLGSGPLSWSPDGQNIVFQSVHERQPGTDPSLYVIGADGSGLARLTFGDHHDKFPAWSPDGRRIAFHRNCSLAIISPDGSGEQVIVPGTDTICPGTIAWSPDSQQIAFNSWHDPFPDDLKFVIYVVNSDGTNLRKLGKFEGGNVPTWSPDGRQIGVEDMGNAYLLNVDGSGEPVKVSSIPDSWHAWYWPQWGGEATAAIAPTPTASGLTLELCDGDVCLRRDAGEPSPLGLARTYYDFAPWRGIPGWSPDGSRFVFSACHTDHVSQCRSDLYIASQDGSEVTLVQRNPDHNATDPVWSPDGEWIAFADTGPLTIVRPDGTDKTVLDHTTGACAQGIAWSPDSRRIAWVGRGEGCQGKTDAIWIAGHDGSQALVLRSSERQFAERYIAWSPDGESLAVMLDDGLAYHIGAECIDGRKTCDESALTEMSAFPEHWRHNFYPQWGGEAQSDSQIVQAHAFAGPILQAIAGKPPDSQDDFSNPKSGWQQANTGDGASGYLNGEFFVIANPSSSRATVQCYEAVSAAPEMSDFVLEIDGRFVSGKVGEEPGDWQIQFRKWFTPDKPSYKHDNLHVGRDSERADFGRCYSKDCSNLASYSGAAITSGAGWNHIQIVAKGFELAAYANGEPIMYFDDSQHQKDWRAGRFSLVVCNYGDVPMEARWDNLRIWDLSKLPSAAATTGAEAEQARAFAEPILKAVADRKADVGDDFSAVDQNWNCDSKPLGTTEECQIADDVVRITPARGGLSDLSHAWMVAGSFVLKIDARQVSGSCASGFQFFVMGPDRWNNLHLSPCMSEASTHVGFGGQTHPELDGSGGSVRPIGETNHVLIIARGPRFAFYLNDMLVAYIEESHLDAVHQIGFRCNALPEMVCEFDNVKFWNLDNAPGLP